MACAANFNPQARGRELDDLEAKITELWGYLNVATYRFLQLVAEFDREEERARQHSTMVELAVRHRRRGRARESPRRARARATAGDRRRLREGRGLVLESACNDARRDHGERVRARARRAKRNRGARREARAQVSLDAAA